MVENAKLPPKSLKELNWLVGKIGVTPEVPIGVDDVVDLRSHRRRRECGDIAVAGGGPADEVVLACRQVGWRNRDKLEARGSAIPGQRGGGKLSL